MKNNLKKILGLMLALILVLAACGNNQKEESGENNGEKAASQTGTINVVSREALSGTRGAFVEIVGIVDEKGDDATRVDAAIQSGTGNVITQVSGDDHAIGYVSLGSVDKSVVKALVIDGVEATEGNVLSDKYAIQRPFLFVYKSEADLSPAAADFMKYALSAEGQAVVVSEGYVTVDTEAPAFEVTPGLSGTVSITGSSSVSPLAEYWADEYMDLNPDVIVNVQSSGSGTGIQEAMDGVNDIGMSSRELKAEETLESKSVARDGIAVIVSPSNPVSEISLENIKEIYLGNITKWEELK